MSINENKKEPSLKENQIIQLVAQEIQFKSQKLHFNFGTKLQTSVAMILRPALSTDPILIKEMITKLAEIRKKDENHYITERIPHSSLKEILSNDSLKFEIFLAQRHKNDNGATDLYSHQVRFLGGKCEGLREDDFQAVIRAFREESHFDLQDESNNTVYLGALPKNFYTGRVKSRQGDRIERDVMTRAHIFLILDPQRTNEFNFGESLEVAKWVGLKKIFDLDINKGIQERIVDSPQSLTGIFPSYMKSLSQKSVKRLVFLSLDVGMPRNMWGLHATMLIFFVSITIRELQARLKKSPSQYAHFKPLIQQWEDIFTKFASTYCESNSTVLGNLILKYYFNTWKNDFHRRYRQGEGPDYSFLILIGSTAMMFTLDCYYKSLPVTKKPSL